MNDFFKELFHYSYHSNQRLIEAMMSNRDLISQKSLNLVSHILNAQHIWNSRILDQKPSYQVWQMQPAENLQQLDADNYSETLHLLETTDLSKQVSYINSKGDAFTNQAGDILFHVVNHSTYHRGQIASDMKQNGVEPVISDYIFYKR